MVVKNLAAKKKKKVTKPRSIQNLQNVDPSTSTKIILAIRKQEVSQLHEINLTLTQSQARTVRENKIIKQFHS